MNKLSDSEKEKIVQGVRSLEQSHQSMGIPTGSRVICHRCGYAKPLIGAIRNGKYRLTMLDQNQFTFRGRFASRWSKPRKHVVHSRIQYLLRN